jgi:hypothetical protein
LFLSLQAAIDCKPRAIWLSFGSFRNLAPPVKAAGIRLVCQVQTLEQVADVLTLGADVIVAQVGLCSLILNEELPVDSSVSVTQPKLVAGKGFSHFCALVCRAITIMVATNPEAAQTLQPLCSRWGFD